MLSELEAAIAGAKHTLHIEMMLYFNDPMGRRITDALIACAFSYDAQSTEFDKLGRIPVLKARMNADLHMADDLKNTGKGNLFVIFGEPDIDLITETDGQMRVKVNGVDVFKPQTGEVIKIDGGQYI